MARRSLLFSKKRGSKAPISKKRKADEELQKPCSTKRVRNIRLPDEEEEIGDFIVVDTGTLYEPKGTSRRFTIDEENNAISAPRTSENPLPSIELLEEEQEVIVKATPEISSPESDGAHQASEYPLVLPSASRENSEDRTSRGQSLELSENHIPAGSKDDPIILSPLPTIDEEIPPSPVEVSPPDKLHSSITIPLSPVFGYCAQVPQASEDVRISHPSFNPSSTSKEPLNLDFPIVQSYGPSTSETTTPSNDQHNKPLPIKIPAPRRFGDTPLGVLVTRGDQCPSKFVVSGIASNSEASQQASTQNYSQARSGVTWFETVTEARADISPEPPASESPRRAELGSTREGGLGISTVLQDIPERPDQDLSDAIGSVDPASQEKCSNEPEFNNQFSRNCEIASKEAPEASPDMVRKRRVEDQQRQTSLSDKEPFLDVGSGPKKFPLLAGYPKLSTETTTFSGWNLLNSTTNKPKLILHPRTPVSASRCSPQTLRFTSDNRAESTLTTVEVQRLIQLFVKDSVVILPREQAASARTYPAGVILWQSLHEFHKWYIKEGKLGTGSEARSSPTTTMKFELLDVQWQPENVFYLPRKATGDEFRDLKQYIWDLFWVLANLNGAEHTKPFRVSITPAADMMDGAKLGHLTTLYSPTPIELSPEFRRPPSSHTTFGNTVTTHHHHRIPSVHPQSLTLDSPQVTLEVQGPKTPHLLWNFLQKNGNEADTSRPPSLHPSPTRPESQESSAVRIEQLHPPPPRPECDIIAAFLPHPPARFPSIGGQTNNSEPQVNLPPLILHGTAKNTPSDSQASASSQNTDFNRATQLPSPRPSPVVAETHRMEQLRTQPATADNSYAANTARPMFSAQPQKDHTAPRTLLPSPQNVRVTNTTQPAPNVQAAADIPPPPPPQDKGKEIQTNAPSIIPQTSRTPREKKRFRDNALQMISGRPNIELDSDETTGGRKRTYPEISGVIVDKNSEMGLVVITERGYTVNQVNTGQDVYFDQYTELIPREGQACVIHGSSTVLYYKQRSRSLHQESQSPPRRPLPSQAPGQRIIRNLFTEDSVVPPMQAFPTPQETHREASERRREQAPIPPSTAEIKIRVQKDAAGHFTGPHDFEVFTLTANLQGFFWWFTKRTGRGGDIGPERLRVTLKDAMPVAKTFDLHTGRPWAVMEEYFEKMKKDIVVECEQAKAFMPELKEFGVLVVDPEWKEGRDDAVR